MKDVIFLLVSTCACISAHCQVKSKMNLILRIDRDVITYTDFAQLILEKEGRSDTCIACYSPGYLEIYAKDSVVALGDFKMATVRFAYSKYEATGAKTYEYRILFSPRAVLDRFNVISIFNMDNHLNKKELSHQKDDKYVYDYLYPGGGAMVVRL